MFTHLHVHTEYSMLDGLSRLSDLVDKTKELGMDSIAITDHGGMYGAIDFYRLAKKAGVKPIIGSEMYVAPSSRHDKSAADRTPYHMTVLAKNEVGYQNLVKLSTQSHLEGFYYKPRIDRELLERYHEGLIVMTGCPSGEVPKAIMSGDMNKAKDTVGWYRELFGDDYYLELMNHGDVPDLPTINAGIMDLHRDTGIQLVATNDSHYTNKVDAPLQDILICVQTNTNVEDGKRLRMEEHSYYIKSPEEMAAAFKETPDAISNTMAIAEKCNIEIDFSQLRVPQYPLPDGMTADQYLADLCWKGFKERIGEGTSEYIERMKYELEVIRVTQYPNYFLVVWDIAHFVRVNDIFFAVRGSAAASLVLYCLGVTNVDPMPYKLVFERFLNLERKEMPDIDMDFQDDRREEVINYCVDKYGGDHVAQIITFGTFGAKASIRDVGRALAMPYPDVDRIAKLVPLKLHVTLDEALEINPELKEIYDTESPVKKLVDTARGMEGLTRHSSTHAAAVLISEDRLDDFVPLQRPNKGDEGSVAMTQYGSDPCAALGLLKMDFLGLVNLSILAKSRDLVRENHSVDIDLNEIPLDDPETYNLLGRGDTVGVFQLEGSGMTRYIKELKPTTLGDVAAMIALYRPGPMEHIARFIDAKHGRIAVTYPHPALEEILEETYGVIVYQDQVLHIARKFAGYSLGEADIVRKAMGKKIAAIMAEERGKFIKGSIDQGYTQEMAETVFSLIEPFAGYAFNKAHSVSYGLISYFTAFYKAHYPAEYMTSLLNAYVGNTEKVIAAIAECRQMGIEIELPDLNKSRADFSIETGSEGGAAIRFGMAAVKNVGTGAVASLIETRDKEGGFESIEHMCKVADMGGVNRKTLESLIKVGAFDNFGDRTAVLGALDRIVSLAQSEAKMRDSNQTSMFEALGDAMSSDMTVIDLPDLETTDRDKGAWESELLGVSLSGGNPIADILDQIGAGTIVFKSAINGDTPRAKVNVVGEVISTAQRYTREQKPFLVITLGLMDGQIEALVWDELSKKTQDVWVEGNIASLTATVRMRDDEASLSCSAAEIFKPSKTPIGINSVMTSDMGSSPNINSTPVPPAQAVPQPPTPIGAYGNGNGSNGNSGNGSSNGNGNGQSAYPPPMASPYAANRRLSLRIQETGRADRDMYLFDDVTKLLLEHAGADEVTLEIATGGRLVRLEWPQVRVNACEELERQLADLLGDAGKATILQR